MKKLITWSLNPAMLQEAPSRQEPPRTFPSIPRKCNAIVTEEDLTEMLDERYAEFICLRGRT